MYVPLISEYRFDPSEDPKSANFDLMHYGYVCIVDENSNVLYSAGDCDDLVFYRSASKPIQALPVFKYGLDKVLTQMANGQRTFVLNWPEWIFWSFVPIGAACMILHFIEYLVDYCAKEKEGTK